MTFQLPYQILRIPIDDVLSEVQRLRSEGLVPVILGSQREAEDLDGEFACSRQGEPLELLARAESFGIDQWVAAGPTAEDVETVLEEELWPRDAQPVTLMWALDGDARQRDQADELLVALLPVSEAWMAPCFLKLGCYNYAPRAEALSAVCKYWFDRYGARITAVTNRTIEFMVGNPPQTRADAVELALQHYTVCDDIVDQNYESMAAYAACLQNATVWSLWWD